MEITKPYYEKSEDLTEKRSFYETMYQLNNKLGLYKEAIQYAETFIAVNDSIMIGEKANQFSELEAKYENQKKQSQILLQEEQIKKKGYAQLHLPG